MPETQFRLRYARWMRPILVASGMGPKRVEVELSDTELRVRAGPWFRATVPRSSLRSAERRRRSYSATWSPRRAARTA